MIDWTEAKAGFSEPNILNDKVFDHQIKNTLGITELLKLSDHSEILVCHLNVGLSYPCFVAGAKGWTVRSLKWYMSWV